jgi:hypothetical protein
LTLPPAAVAGSTLHYQVSLTNDSHEPITMTSCPAYTQADGPQGTSVREYLNCPPDMSWQPGTVVTFQMQLDVPAHAGTRGYLKLLWQLDGGPSAGSALQISDA